MIQKESQRSISEELDVLNKPISETLSRSLIEDGERCSLIGTVPLSQVITDHSIIDENHVKELANSMKTSDRGQISPTTVRARIDDETDKLVFDVVDGFHRTEALRRNGADSVKVSSMYGCSDEELYDLRILAAQSVQSVQYARIATWMRLAFNNTPWAEKGMDVTRAFGVTLNDTKRPQGVDFDSQEVEKMKDWVRGTSDRWNKGLNQTYQTLKLVDDADPKLVEQVRTQGGGKDRKAVVTPTLLKLTVESFPGQDNYTLQNAVMDIILDKRFYIPQARAFIEQAEPFLKEGMSREDATKAILDNVNLDNIGVIFEKQRAKPTGEQKRDVSRRHRKSLQEARGEMDVLQEKIRSQDITIKELREENEDLKYQLSLYKDLARGAVSNSNGELTSHKILDGSRIRSEKPSKLIDPRAMAIPDGGDLKPKVKPAAEEEPLKKKVEVILSPEEIAKSFMSKFGDIVLPTIVGGFFLNHKQWVSDYEATPINQDIVEALGKAFDKESSSRPPINHGNIHAQRVEGLTLLKKFADLPLEIREEATKSLIPEVQDLITYGVYLNDSNVLSLMKQLAMEEHRDSQAGESGRSI